MRSSHVFLAFSIFFSSAAFVEQEFLNVDIGYPPGEEPVALTPEALLPQVVFGATTTIYANSAVEPTLAVNPVDPCFIVAAWQQGRINNFGALEAGIAYSHDSGESWERTIVPLQISEGGINQRITDVWLSYSKKGDILYLNALVVNATLDRNTNNQIAMVVAVSEDNGAFWSSPRFLFSSQEFLNEPTGAFELPDKNSITADPNYENIAYSVYDSGIANSLHDDTYFNKTINYGKTWSQNKIIYNPFPDLLATGLSNNNPNDCQTVGNVIVVQPLNRKHPSREKNGDLLNFMMRQYAKPGATDAQYRSDTFPFQYTAFDIAMIRSQDLGETWTPNATIIKTYAQNPRVYTGGYTYLGNTITGGVGTLMRTGEPFPGFTVNPKNGFLYVTYQTGEFTTNQLPQIGLTASYDGGYTWSPSIRVSRTPLNAPNPQAFTTSVAVTEDGYIGVLYFDFRNDDKLAPSKTLMDAWLAIYQDTDWGIEFIREIRLSQKSYVAQNGPDTTQGVMTDGDYQFLVAQGNSFYAVYTKSFNGPFSPATVIINDPRSKTQLLLDKNLRTSVFFSCIGIN